MVYNTLRFVKYEKLNVRKKISDEMKVSIEDKVKSDILTKVSVQNFF